MMRMISGYKLYSLHLTWIYVSFLLVMVVSTYTPLHLKFVVTYKCRHPKTLFRIFIYDTSPLWRLYQFFNMYWSNHHLLSVTSIKLSPNLYWLIFQWILLQPKLITKSIKRYIIYFINQNSLLILNPHYT